MIHAPMYRPGPIKLSPGTRVGGVAGKEHAYDVLTERKVEGPLFTEPKAWDKSVTVGANQSSVVNFVISNK